MISGDKEKGFAYLERMQQDVKPSDTTSQYVYETTVHDANARRRVVPDGTYNKYPWDFINVPLKISSSTTLNRRVAGRRVTEILVP